MLDFSAAAFTLQVAINLRAALKLVEPDQHCLLLADLVLAQAEEYGDTRSFGAADPFSIAEAGLDEALVLLFLEMKRCDSDCPKEPRVLAPVLVDKLPSGLRYPVPRDRSATLQDLQTKV